MTVKTYDNRIDFPRCHDLKCWPGPFRAIVAGVKRHEFRLNDRGYELGDMLYLYEWDPSKGLTGFYTVVQVIYVNHGFGIPNAYKCMSIAGVKRESVKHYIPGELTFLETPNAI